MTNKKRFCCKAFFAKEKKSLPILNKTILVCTRTIPAYLNVHEQRKYQRIICRLKNLERRFITIKDLEKKLELHVRITMLKHTLELIKQEGF